MVIGTRLDLERGGVHRFPARRDLTMLARTGLDPQEALVCTMVLVAATGGGITDREIGVMSGLVQTLPVFRTFSTERLQTAAEAAVGLLDEEEGLAHAAKLIRGALEPRLRETAYALACEVVAADRFAQQDCLRMLEFVRAELNLDPLVTAAIERGARARHQQV
jgi:tellurite resistance protein